MYLEWLSAVCVQFGAGNLKRTGCYKLKGILQCNLVGNKLGVKG